MREVEFCVPYPRSKSAYCKRYGLNSYWSGKPWPVRKKDADDMHAVVAYALQAQGVTRSLFERPVRITFWHDDNMDIDNHAVVEKLIVDALKGWLLENDGKRWYRERISKFHDMDCVRVRIEEIGK